MNTSNHDPFLSVHQKMLLHGESPLLSRRRGRRQSEKIESVSNSFMTDDQVQGSKSHGALTEYFSKQARRQTISFGGGESKQDDYSGDALFREVRNKTYSKQGHRSNESKGIPSKRSVERNRALRCGQDNSAQSVVNGVHKSTSHSSNPENNRQRRSRRNSIMLQNRHTKEEPNTRTESGRDHNLSLRGTVSEGRISNNMRNVLSNHNVQDEQNTKWESEGRYGSSSVEKRVSGNDDKLLQDNAKQIRSIMNRIAFEKLPDMRMMRDKASRRTSTKTAANSQFKLERKSKQSRGGIKSIVSKDYRGKRQNIHTSSKVKSRKAPELVIESDESVVPSRNKYRCDGINPDVPKDCRDKRQGIYTSSKAGPRTAPESVIESDESVIPLYISEKRPVKVASIFAYPAVMKLIQEAEKKNDPNQIQVPIHAAQINKVQRHEVGRCPPILRDESVVQNDCNYSYLDKLTSSIDNERNTLAIPNKNELIKPKRGITTSWSWKSSKSEASQDEDTAKKGEREKLSKEELFEWFRYCREGDKIACKQRRSSTNLEQKRSTYDPSRDRHLMEEIAIEAKSEEEYKESYHEQNTAALIQTAARLIESRNVADGFNFPLPGQILKIIRLLAGNDRCCDCGSSAKLTFASVDHGQILCDTCAFHHIISGRDDYVKSLETDFDWKYEEVIKLLMGGNEIFSTKIYGTENGRKGPLTKHQRQSVYESSRAIAHKIALSQIAKSVPKTFVDRAFK